MKAAGNFTIPELILDIGADHQKLITVTENLSIYSLLIVGIVVAFAALRRSPTPSHLLLMVIGVAVLCALDLVRTFKTGRADTWLNGTATREHQPRRFWKYIFEGYAFLALCVIAFISVLLWPDFFH